MLFFILFFLGCSAELGLSDTSADVVDQTQQCATLKGHQICDFYATDTTGQQMNISDLYGKPIVLDLSAAWCGPCIAAAAEMQSKAEALPEVTFLTVLIEDTAGQPPTAQDIIQWSDSHGIQTAPVWGSSRDIITSDPLELKDHLYLSGWPTFYFIDSEGKIQEYMKGYNGSAILEAAQNLD